jgi:hypothetical protein
MAGVSVIGVIKTKREKIIDEEITGITVICGTGCPVSGCGRNVEITFQAGGY